MAQANHGFKILLGVVLLGSASAEAVRNRALPGTARRSIAQTPPPATPPGAPGQTTPPPPAESTPGSAVDDMFPDNGTAALPPPPGGTNPDMGSLPPAPAPSVAPPSSSGGGPSFSSALPSTIPARATPGAKTAQPAAPAKMQDYVALDDSIKNEMYGTIDYRNAELKDIIGAISKLAQKNFILDRKVENRRVTILSPQAVTKQEAYNLFLSVLYMNDLTVVAKGKFLEIIESKAAQQSNIRVFAGDYAPDSEEIVTLLYPLKFLNADEIQRFLTELVPRSGRITSYPNTNTLVMTDTGLNLRRLIAVLKSIDVPGHEDQLESIPIRFANAKGIAQLIEDILDAQNGRRGGPGPGPRGVPQKTRGGGIITKIVPDERTNALVVLANGRGVMELKNLVNKLDTPDAAGGGNIHIYYCKNAVAEELSTTITSLISGQKPSTTGAPGGATPPPAAAPVVNLPSINAGAPRRGDEGGVKFEGNIRITADKPTNSLVIIASGSDFAALKTILQKLDIPRRQVYVEATIMEVTAGGSRDFGTGINIAAPGIAQVGGFVPSQGVKGSDMIGAVTSPAFLTGLVTGITAGKKVQFKDLSGTTRDISTVTGLIRALEETKQANILHQPQILTSDNQEAEIKVTQKIPTLSSTTSLTGTTTGIPTTNTYTNNDVAISLKLTPQLGEGNDLIKLKVEQAMDDFAPSSQGNGQIDITQRKATTNVVVRNGDTVVVGGLQKNAAKDSRSKFPILGDIPIIGWLFKGSHGENEKTNLMLFLTPHIINEYKDLVKITQGKLDDRERMGKQLFDPTDRHADEVKRIKKIVAEDLKKPSPKGWSFKPRLGMDSAPPAEAAETPPPPPAPSAENAAPAEGSAPQGVDKTDASAYLQPEAPPRSANATTTPGTEGAPSALRNQGNPPGPGDAPMDENDLPAGASRAAPQGR